MEEFASFSEQPSTPQLPPPPPPRDINPFGQPVTPGSKESGGVDLNSSLEPPRPSTPPPPTPTPPPVPSKQQGDGPSPPAPGSPLPPTSPPPPLPGGDDVGVAAVAAAAVAVAAGVSGKRKGENQKGAETMAQVASSFVSLQTNIDCCCCVGL